MYLESFFKAIRHLNLMIFVKTSTKIGLSQTQRLTGLYTKPRFKGQKLKSIMNYILCHFFFLVKYPNLFILCIYTYTNVFNTIMIRVIFFLRKSFEKVFWFSSITPEGVSRCPRARQRWKRTLYQASGL